MADFKRVRKIAEVTVSFVVSVCPSAWNYSAPTGWIFMKFYNLMFFEKLLKSSNFIKIEQK